MLAALKYCAQGVCELAVFNFSSSPYKKTNFDVSKTAMKCNYLNVVKKKTVDLMCPSRELKLVAKDSAYVSR